MTDHPEQEHALSRVAGDGGITPAAYVAAANLRCAFDVDGLPDPVVAAAPGGGLVLEWVVGERVLEVEVSPDGRADFLAQDGDDPIENLYARWLREGAGAAPGDD